jgi:hypothetical protein
MTRGGRRPRFAPSYALRVYASGRRGIRRVRVTECWSMLKAEDVYTALLRDDASGTGPGARGAFRCTVQGREFIASWEVVANAVWRRGRVFLRCPRCSLRCTRLYLPLETSSPACRCCWGLTYWSRTQSNYKDSLWGRGEIARMFGTSQRDWAYDRTDEARNERRERSHARWEDRKRATSRRRAANKS